MVILFFAGDSFSKDISHVTLSDESKAELEKYRLALESIDIYPVKSELMLEDLAGSGFMLADYAALDLARNYLKRGDSESGIATLEKFLERRMKSPLTPIMNSELIRASCEKIESKRCAKYLKIGRITDSFAPERSYLEAMRLEAVGKKMKAYRAHQKVYYGYPNSPFANKSFTATSRLHSSTDLDYPYATFDERMGRVEKLVKAYKYDRAITDLEKISKIPYSPARSEKAAFRLAEVKRMARRRVEAKADYIKFLKRYPNSGLKSQAHYDIARIDWNLNSDKTAIERLTMLLKKGLSKEIKINSLFILGKIAESNESYPDARKYFTSALKLRPWIAMEKELRWRIGWFHFIEGNYNEAGDAFTSGARRIPADERDGRFLFWARKSYEMAGESGKAEKAKNELTKFFPHTYYGATVNADNKNRVLSPAGPGSINSAVGFNEATRLSNRQKRIYRRYKGLLLVGKPEEARREANLLCKGLRVTQSSALWMGNLYKATGNSRKSITLQSLVLTTLDRKDDFTDPFWRAYYPTDHLQLIQDESKIAGVDPFLTLSIIRQESAFDQTSRSTADARGLMQIIPPTGERLYKESGLKGSFNSANLFEPGLNIKLGVFYLRKLLNRYQKSLTHALAAYNAGESAVDKWRIRFGDIPDERFTEMIPYAETREYVKKVKRNLALYRAIYGE